MGEVEVGAAQKDGYPYWLRGLSGAEGCSWPCAVCGRESVALIQVQLARPAPEYGKEAYVLRTELVCSEGCAIRFVDAGAPDDMTGNR